MAGPIRVALEGDKAMKSALQKAIIEAPKELRRSLLEYADTLVPIVKDRTPVKTGALRDSIRARVMVSGKREDLRVSILAGGSGCKTPARIVHEIHPTHSKFLESVILEARGSALVDISAKVSEKRLAGQ